VATHYRPTRALLVFSLALIGIGVWALKGGESTAPRLGLDLRGGTQVILSPKSATGEITSDQIAQSVSILRQRVDGFGVAEAEVTTQGQGATTKIIVTLPGTTDRAVVDDLKSTAKLAFRQVITFDYGTPLPVASASPSASNTPVPTPQIDPSLLTPPIQAATLDEDLAARFAALDCADSQVLAGGGLDDETAYLVTCEEDGSYKYVLAPAALSGTDIESAIAGLPQQGAGGWQVDLTMTSDGAKKFAEITTQLATQQSPQNQFGIVLDGLVVSAPAVNEAILGGSATISGSFTVEEAKALAQVLKYGALPLTLQVDEVSQISPTLGNDQLRAGVLAGAFGLLLVVIYLMVYYRALGIVAVASLFIAAIALYLTVVVLGNEINFTMTLAGIAGAIVAIGITADSFVIYFERIRDELREGKRLRTAVDAGWERARRTILAADFVSLLAATVLYFLSVGSVRGFAFTLGLTTVIDILVAFYFTRPLMVTFAKNKWMNQGSALTGVSPKRLGAVEQNVEVTQ
jgi:preprotein translocase subunit SecD